MRAHRVEGLCKQVCGHIPVDSRNGLRFQKCRAQLWRNSKLGIRRELCIFFQARGLLAQATIHDYSSADLCRILALSLCHGFMAMPSGRSATPDIVATTVCVAVLITEGLDDK